MERDYRRYPFIKNIIVKGDVALALSLCETKEDKPFIAFILLNTAPAEYYQEYLSELDKCLEGTDIVKKCILCKENLTIPTAIWINKIKADLLKNRHNIDIKRLLFTTMLEDSMLLNDIATRELIQEVLTDDRLDYLKDIATYYLDTLNDGRSVLYQPLETQAKVLSAKNNKSYEFCKYLLGISIFKLTLLSISPLVLPTDRSKQKREESLNNLFIVKKLLKENDRVVSEKEFDSQDDAVAYIDYIGKAYPELEKDFYFKIMVKQD